jgi:hypothetical protein
MIPIAAFMFIHDNITRLVAYHILIMTGMVMAGGIALLYKTDAWHDGVALMIITGIGLYLAYVPFSSILYDVIIAAFKYRANNGFLMYLSDSLGYLASVAVLFVKNFGTNGSDWLSFFLIGALVTAVVGIGMMSISLVYYLGKYRKWGGQSLEFMDQGLLVHSTLSDYDIGKS